MNCVNYKDAVWLTIIPCLVVETSLNNAVIKSVKSEEKPMIRELAAKIKTGREITYEEAVRCSQLNNDQLLELLIVAADLTRDFYNKKVELCAIINAKSGHCSEDCHYCAQSGHYQTGVEVYPMLPTDKVLARAKEMEANGVTRYALVTSGRALSDNNFRQALVTFRQLHQQTNLCLCASFGILNSDQLQQLKEAGVTRYHHNLETSRSNFEKICSTHTYDERIATVKAAQEAGLQVCSGGIFSIGETWEQRIEMAFELKDLKVDSIPINILVPIKGTPLEHQAIMSPLDILKTIAIFRLIMPRTSLRICGGHEKALRDLQAIMFIAGIDAAMVGNYLTTKGRTITEDIQMINDMGLSIC